MQFRGLLGEGRTGVTELVGELLVRREEVCGDMDWLCKQQRRVRLGGYEQALVLEGLSL